jgi:hypothetical protein
MNPAMLILIFIGAIILWFLCSSLYKTVGETVGDVIESAIHEIKSEDNCIGCTNLWIRNDGGAECLENLEDICIPNEFKFKERKD